MLFVVKAGNEEHVRKTFDNEILPRITPAFSRAGTAICWTNIGGSTKTSELAAYLKENKMKPGCFFFKDGELKNKKAIGALHTSMDYVNIAMALIRE